MFMLVPRAALSISPDMVQILHRHCSQLGQHVIAPWVTIAMAYFTFMKQTNLLSPARIPSGVGLGACGLAGLRLRAWQVWTWPCSGQVLGWDLGALGWGFRLSLGLY